MSSIFLETLPNRAAVFGLQGILGGWKLREVGAVVLSLKMYEANRLVTCSSETGFLLQKTEALRPSTDWKLPTHIIKGEVL